MSNRLLAIAVISALWSATGVYAGAPTPPNRAQAVLNVCRSGTDKGNACDPTDDNACPGSICEVQFVSKNIAGILTVIYDDFVLDWAASAGGTPVGGPKALTLMLEVKVDGTTHLLTETYQNVADVTLDPQIDVDVMAFQLTESLLVTAPLAGLQNAHPEAMMAAKLRDLFGAPADSIPILVGFSKKQVTDDHTGDQLATVARTKVKLRFATLAP
jgi:hypothetical protein